MATATKRTRKSTPMSDAHKAALAKGREEGAAIRRYLDALEASAPKRGRRRTPESIKKRLAAIEERLPEETNSLTWVQLVQERSDLEDELGRDEEKIDLTELEKGFVKAVKPYSARKGITYSTWRTAGVSAEVLRKAGIPRSRG